MTIIRAYLRASTSEQDAQRARGALTEAAKAHSKRVATFYAENESGASLQRPELFKLLADSESGDILLIEQVDRLTRLTEADWLKLRSEIDRRGVHVVALDVPTSLEILKGGPLAGIVGALNRFLFDVLAVTARKDYEDRRRRAAEGMAKAKEAGKLKGKPADEKRHQLIRRMLARRDSWTDIETATSASRSTIARIARAVKETPAEE